MKWAKDDVLGEKIAIVSGQKMHVAIAVKHSSLEWITVLYSRPMVKLSILRGITG